MKTMLVTGGTNGIGLETARGLAARRAQVILIASNRERGKQAAADIARTTGNPHIIFLAADLARQREVRRVAGLVRERFPTLSVLVNNLGVVNTEHVLTEEGVEHTMAVNHYAPFLLTYELLPLLRQNDPARIINVSSTAHKLAGMDFENLNGENGYGLSKAYNQSKLANLLFTYALASRLEGTGVTVNAVDPGGAKSGLAVGEGIPFMYRALRMIAPHPSKAAKTVIYLASDPTIASVSGKYYTSMKEAKSSSASYDKAAQHRLWQISAEVTQVAVDYGLTPEV